MRVSQTTNQRNYLIRKGKTKTTRTENKYINEELRIRIMEELSDG